MEGSGHPVRAASRRAQSRRLGSTWIARSAAKCRKCCTERLTGGAAAAPQTEYILVSAIEAEGQAWVEVDAGIDINPAALQLPGVSLTP